MIKEPINVIMVSYQDHVEPIRFQNIQPDDSRTFRIHRHHIIDDNRHAGTRVQIFRCFFDFQDGEHTREGSVDLFFNYATCTWFIVRKE